MTPLQRQRQREKRQRAKARERLRIDKRKAKRAAKASPKKALKEWGWEICKGGRCEVCGLEVGLPSLDVHGTPKVSKHGKAILNQLHPHHVLPKERYPEFKLEPMNGVCLCPKHHRFDKFSAHRNPLWFVWWLRAYNLEKYRWAMAHMGDCR